MNKLYVIRWYLPNGYEIGTTYYWKYSDMKKVINANDDIRFETVENNDCHMIVKAY